MRGFREVVKMFFSYFFKNVFVFDFGVGRFSFGGGAICGFSEDRVRVVG